MKPLISPLNIDREESSHRKAITLTNFASVELRLFILIFSYNFLIASYHPPQFRANLADKIPGSSFSAFIHKPESSDKLIRPSGILFALSTAFSSKVFPVSSTSSIPIEDEVVILTLYLENRLLNSLILPLLCEATTILFLVKFLSRLFYCLF